MLNKVTFSVNRQLAKITRYFNGSAHEIKGYLFFAETQKVGNYLTFEDGKESYNFSTLYNLDLFEKVCLLHKKF